MIKQYKTSNSYSILHELFQNQYVFTVLKLVNTATQAECNKIIKKKKNHKAERKMNVNSEHCLSKPESR